MASGPTPAVSRARKRKRGSWVRTRRSVLRPVSSSSPFRTGLATLMASGSTPVLTLHGMTMKRRFPFRQFHRNPPVYSLRVHWVPFVSLFSQARGLRRQSSSWCARLSRAQTTMPHPTLHEGLGVSLGSPLPTSHSPSHPSRSLPCSTWKTQTECCRWRVCLLAPSALCGSPVFAQRGRQVDRCDEGHTSQTGWPSSVLSPLVYDFRLDWLT
jgi:hypothetical protein